MTLFSIQDDIEIEDQREGFDDEKDSNLSKGESVRDL